MFLMSLSGIKSEYIIIIAFSAIIIISFVFNFISKKTNIPSVLLLMALGVLVQHYYPHLKEHPLISDALILVGKIGLILIVLEAALDLKLTKEKTGLIVKAFVSAFLGVVLTSVAIALIIEYFYHSSFINSFVYAIPLAILSSAIVIPSVTSLTEFKKEFLIYESAFSDILGIIFFQYLVSNSDSLNQPLRMFGVIMSDIVITSIVALIFSYIAVWGIQKLTSHVKLFLVIAILLLVYALGAIFHISSLIFILMFGLVLNNAHTFFKGFFANFIQLDKLNEIYKEFHLITLESSFVLRTFFFVSFGLTISVATLFNYKLTLEALAVITVIYLLRFILLKLIFWHKNILVETFISPRGLITILLFYSIPTAFVIPDFDAGLLLYIILVTGFIMTLSLVLSSGKKDIKTIIHDMEELNCMMEESLEDNKYDLTQFIDQKKHK